MSGQRVLGRSNIRKLIEAEDQPKGRVHKTSDRSGGENLIAIDDGNIMRWSLFRAMTNAHQGHQSATGSVV